MFQRFSEQENVKASFDAFTFLVDHNLRLATSLYNKAESRRGNVLTVMSFCLIGEMTFIAACHQMMVVHWWSWIIALVIFSTWLAAFVLTIRLRLQMCEVVLYPTGDNEIRFLPTSKEINTFHPRNIVRRDSLSKHIMTAYFERCDSNEDPADDAGVLERQYYEALRRETDCLTFSKNAWLADSTIQAIHAIKFGQWARTRFKRIYATFTANLIIFFGMIVVLVVFECLRYHFGG